MFGNDIRCSFGRNGGPFAHGERCLLDKGHEGDHIFESDHRAPVEVPDTFPQEWLDSV